MTLWCRDTSVKGSGMPDLRLCLSGPDKRERFYAKRRTLSRDAYLARPFVAWDGEGLTIDGRHLFVMLAGSDGSYVQDKHGLSTEECFETFLDSDPASIHVIYGSGYDVNKILKDMDRETLEKLYFNGRVRWNGYSVSWRPGKCFGLRTEKRKFLLYDVLPFFQTSFVKACDEYLGNDYPGRSLIVSGKGMRGGFRLEDMEYMREYNNAELAALAALANELRQRLYNADLRIQRWDGPGAIASALYKQHNTKQAIAPCPDGVAKAGQHAYAGGRFEIVRKGHSTCPAFQYDIRSAYPNAARYLPCLAHGEWRQWTGNPVRPFGVYRVQKVTPDRTDTMPHLLWQRNKDGTVYFTDSSHGWYWSPEAQLASELPGHVIHEGWEWIPECAHEPFWFVEPLYQKRAALKRAGDGAHVGLKLGLNSLYGKLAQQVGWNPGPPLRIPPYHCLEWAGWITSHCRAALYRAALLAPDDIIAFETDAIFSRSPLALPVGERLGEWEETAYVDLSYFKSGMYYGRTRTGKTVEKSRGINQGSVTREKVIDALATDAPIEAEQTRFITLGQALHQDFSQWGQWVTTPRVLQTLLDGKRIDLYDSRDEWKPLEDGWTETVGGFHATDFSYPYEIAWKAETLTSPDGRTLRMLRNADSDEAFQI